MTNTEKVQPMEVDQKKPEEKVEEKPELVSRKTSSHSYEICAISLFRKCF